MTEQTQPKPLTALDLDEISARAAHLHEYACQGDGEGDTLAGTDVPALIAELRRQQARVAKLEEQRERRRVRLAAAEADLLEMRGLLSPNGQPRRIPDEVEIHERVAPAVEWLLNRVTELEADLARYVGHESTIADEMAYLTRCLDTVHDLCDLAKQRDRATVTVAELELSLNCEWQAPTPRPALPWAHAMEASDLHLFLDDLVSAAMNRWRTDVDGPVPDRETLAAIEKACTDWRTPGQGLRSDEPGTGERQ